MQCRQLRERERETGTKQLTVFTGTWQPDRHCMLAVNALPCQEVIRHRVSRGDKAIWLTGEQGQCWYQLSLFCTEMYAYLESFMFRLSPLKNSSKHFHQSLLFC